MKTTDLQAREKYEIIHSDPNDPSTWPMWDALGLWAFGEEYKQAYQEFRKKLRESAGLETDVTC